MPGPSSTNYLRQTQELEARPRDAGSHVDHLRRNLVANSSRHELHGAASPDAHPLYVLQLGLPHLLVDGVVLHPVCRDGPALLANISHDSPAHA